MKKIVSLSSSLLALAVFLASCLKTTPDPLTAVTGHFKGVLTDSDIVTHQVTTHTAFPITITKLTSSRIGLGSDSTGLYDFYADIAASGSDFAGSIPGQSIDTINIQGTAGAGLPVGTSLQFLNSNKQLTFAVKYSYTNSSVRGRVVLYQGVKQ